MGRGEPTSVCKQVCPLYLDDIIQIFLSSSSEVRLVEVLDNVCERSDYKVSPVVAMGTDLS